MDFLQGLNPQQKAAAAHVEGPLLLLAGAGSGKTRVITHRIAHLVEAHHVPGPCILAVTFTNKAADEMRQRVVSLLGNTTRRDSPAVSTFHSFCVRLLRRDSDHLADIRNGFTRNFTIYDGDDQVSLIKSIYRALGLDEKFMPYRRPVFPKPSSQRPSGAETSPTQPATTSPRTARSS
jgi:DNA helicase II / ATP-dependent DNA helicase PcrA